MTRVECLEIIRSQRVVAIVRESSALAAYETGCQLIDAGIRALEVSLVTPGAWEAIERLARRVDAERIAIGVGTALSVEHVRRAQGAGVQFVVSPVTDEEVIAACSAADLVSLPGAATPTEALRAHRAGADLVKIFPASLWSPASLHDVLTALPELSPVPTGGVSLENASEWVASGATAVGLGSALLRAVRSGDSSVIPNLLAGLKSSR